MANSVLPHPNSMRKKESKTNHNQNDHKASSLFWHLLKFFVTYTLLVQVENSIFAFTQCYYCIWQPLEVLKFFDDEKEASDSIKSFVAFTGYIQISFLILALISILTLSKERSRLSCPVYLTYTVAICYTLYQMKESKNWNTEYWVVFLSSSYLCLRNLTFLFS